MDIACSRCPWRTPMNDENLEETGIRASEARRALVNALRECGELADAVATFEGSELLEVLLYVDGLRLVMADTTTILQGVVRGDLG